MKRVSVAEQIATSLSYKYAQTGDTRSRAELEDLLGQSFSGVLSSDDFSVYNGYQNATDDWVGQCGNAGGGGRG